jgi:serine/threonine protein kinase
MDQECWRRVKVLFHAALEREPEERQAFLDVACGKDTDLRCQIERLLVKEEEAENFLEAPAFGETTLTRIPPGRQFGPYRIVSPLGAGGMGEVYRAYDCKLGRNVAIKTAHRIRTRPRASGPSAVRRARRFAESSEHSAAIYGLEESDDVDCLVLELVEGESLRGPLPILRALGYAVGSRRAEAAHEMNIHRDLKRIYMVVNPLVRVKVLDFGLAKAIWGSDGERELIHAGETPSAGTLAGQIVGTPGYMSPEQARGENVDTRVDIWAFGCLLYELLTGRRAFPGETLADTIAGYWSASRSGRLCLRKPPRKSANRCGSVSRRMPTAGSTTSDARRTIEEAQRGWNRWRVAAAAAAGLALLGIGAALWLRGPARPGDRSEWVQLTSLPDPVSQPALSPDGRMLAFVRSSSNFYALGEVYVKKLTDGEPEQLTYEDFKKIDQEC